VSVYPQKPEQTVAITSEKAEKAEKKPSLSFSQSKK
jgi:hypothetical protein